MDALIQAIATTFDNNANLVAVATGGLHLSEGPTESTDPYIVFLVTEIPFWGFKIDYERYLITFVLVSSTRGAAEIMSLYTKLKACFDESGMSVTGYINIRFYRVTSGPIERVDDKWTLSVQYECYLEET